MKQYDTVSYRYESIRKTNEMNTDLLRGHPLDSPHDVIADPRRRSRILVAMCLALIAVVASVSGLNVAQQALADDLGATQGQLLWIINGYTIALAALLLPVGAIGDRFGRKPILLTGLTLFVGANLVAALSTSVTMLLVARVVGGAAAAMIMPVTLSVITSSFPAADRARAVGIWSGFAGAGGILGLFVSSFLIDQVTWPWLFVMPIGFAVAALVMSGRAVPNSREHSEHPFDTVGAILSAVAIGGIVLGIHEGPERGWSDALTLTGLVVGTVALVAFVAWELRHQEPLMDLRVFTDRELSTGAIVLTIVFAVMMGLFLVLVQFLQAVAGYSALRASAGLLPMAFLMMPLSAVAPMIAKRVGLRRTMLMGSMAFATGLVLMALMVSSTNPYWSILPGLLVMSVGIGLLMSPGTTAITESLPEERQGVASALNDTVREFGGAVGIALLGSVLNAGYRADIAPVADALPGEAGDAVREGIGQAVGVAQQVGGANGLSILQHAREAFVAGWRHSMWVGVGLAAAVVLYVLIRGPRLDDGDGQGIDADDRGIDAELERVLQNERVLQSDAGPVGTVR